MIEDRDLQSLVEFSGSKVLSVYLDTDLANQSKDAVKLMFRERIRALEDVPEALVTPVQRYLDFEYDWQSRGLAVFAAEEDLWKVIALPISVRSQAYYFDRPYVRVLTDVLDRFARYELALVDREGIRLYSVSNAHIEQEAAAIGDEIRHMKQGGWTTSGSPHSASSSHYEANVALHNLKNSAEVVKSYYQDGERGKLMLGGSPDILAQFKELLPKHVRDQVIGEFAIDMGASPNEILNRSLDIADEVALREEDKLVTGAITAAAKGSVGVTGRSDTLYALHQGRVRVLLVEESFRAPGYVCANCGYVSADRNDACPFCHQNQVVDTPDVVNLAIHKAVETGAAVNIVRENEKLNRAGGMAGILRY